MGTRAGAGLLSWAVKQYPPYLPQPFPSEVRRPTTLGDCTLGAVGGGPAAGARLLTGKRISEWLIPRPPHPRHHWADWMQNVETRRSSLKSRKVVPTFKNSIIQIA